MSLPTLDQDPNKVDWMGMGPMKQSRKSEPLLNTDRDLESGLGEQYGETELFQNTGDQDPNTGHLERSLREQSGETEPSYTNDQLRQLLAEMKAEKDNLLEKLTEEKDKLKVENDKLKAEKDNLRAEMKTEKDHQLAEFKILKENISEEVTQLETKFSEKIVHFQQTLMKGIH